jgi:thiamine-phosphate pyrophosphorylase
MADIGLYPVTNRKLYEGRYTHESVIAALAAGGAKIVQLREKDLTDRELYELALLFRRETERRKMLFLIDDRIDLALATGADGAHLGKNDLPIPAARTIVGGDFILGASSHSPAEAKALEAAGATYVNIGPLFPTPTKPRAVAIGTAPLAETVRHATVPITCMGGVTAETLDEVLATGVRHVGVVSAIFGAPDIAAATRAFVTRIGA